MNIDDMLNKIRAEAEQIDSDSVTRVYGAASVLEGAYFEAQKEILTTLIKCGLLEDATDPPRAMMVAALNILKLSFVQSMANLVMIDALDAEKVRESIPCLLDDIDAALHDATEQAIRAAKDPEAFGFGEVQYYRGKK